ncbi:replication termination factor 2 [Macadamia integrifolia]|uniref:replication termination factor 2 n=1 Tax=Macadamia integrifolia TaxID=60698 RepID=UPI001C4F7FF7|nr:replication termination factor 2 [Macadamia integrifolia]
MKLQDQMQVFIQSPELRVPSRALTVNPNQTLRHLKLSFLPPTTPSQTLNSIYFTFNGKPLHDSATLFDSRILPFSHLLLRIKVSGGGGDGGATGAESRDCYLNMYAVKKPDKVDPNETRLSRWTTCALSFEPLKHPCVIDRLGNVFNKEPLVEALLGKKLPKGFGHIKGLRDMIPIELSVIPGVKDDDISIETKFQCPISGLEFNGKYKFLALRSCGHVLSAKALKEVNSSACLVCHKEFSESDKIVINGSPEEVSELRERMEEEKAKLREKEKKQKKKLKNGEVTGSDGVCLEPSRLSGKKHGVDDQTVEKASAKIEGNGKIANGVVVAAKGTNNAPVKRFKAADMAPPNATKEVYASIFTSSRKSTFKETYSCRSLPLGRN